MHTETNSNLSTSPFTDRPTGSKHRTDQRVRSVAAFSTQCQSTSDRRHSFSLLRILGLMSLFASVRASPFPAQIELASLSGRDGFVINGDKAYDRSGYVVSSAGDVNKDGVDDLLIGAQHASPAKGLEEAGKTYVVFGGEWLRNVGIVDLASLGGSNGFVINGDRFGGLSGISVSGTGDVNGDGISDLIIGAIRAGNSKTGAGYVLFGSRMIGNKGFINLAELDGSDGFRILGEASGNELGCSVSGAGDMNGDGIKDLIIGAWRVQLGSRMLAGRSYVLFGKQGLGDSGTIHLANLNEGQGLVLNGDKGHDLSGFPVSNAGDVNDDGFADVIIGAAGVYHTDGHAIPAGKSYVVFGKSGLEHIKSINLAELTGDDGFVVNGQGAGDASGFSVSGAGDVNADDVDDLIIGAPGATRLQGRDRAGRSYVLFGKKGIGQNGSIDLAMHGREDGFVIDGDKADDWSGFPVSCAGDVNGDGVSDLIIGAMGADPNEREKAGRSYVLFGGQAIGDGQIDLRTFNGEKGFVLNGVKYETMVPGGRANVFTGHGSVSNAGDVDGDNITDLIVGVSWASLKIDGKVNVGKSYVIFGRPPTPASTPPISSTVTTPSSTTSSDEDLTDGEIALISTGGVLGAALITGGCALLIARSAKNDIHLHMHNGTASAPLSTFSPSSQQKPCDSGSEESARSV